MSTNFNRTTRPFSPTCPASSDRVNKKAMGTEICIALDAHAQSEEYLLAHAA